MSRTVLLIGLGDLGGVILELLARQSPPFRIVVASRNLERGVRRTNLARLGAMAQGFQPDVDFERVDVGDRDGLARLVQRVAPDLILMAATRQAWWLTDLLPEGPAAAITEAGFGVWLPIHLTLTLTLMRTLEDVGFQGLTLTAPFPDVVNCVLGRLGLAPTVGFGNLDEIVPKVRLLAARRLGVPTEDVRALLVAHHALEEAAFGKPLAERPPYYVRIEHDGQNVTDRVNAADVLFAPYPIPPGRAIHFLTAGSAVRLVHALSSEVGELVHAPGPNGLPGGYPVIASRTGVRLAPVEGLSLEEAVAINEQSHRFDGIERIEPDGTVVFVEAAADAIKGVLAYDCRRLHPDEAESRADELIRRFREYAKRHGVDVTAHN